jgi:hypothetical protein
MLLISVQIVIEVGNVSASIAALQQVILETKAEQVLLNKELDEQEVDFLLMAGPPG